MRAIQISQYLKEQNRQRQKCQQDIFKAGQTAYSAGGLNHPDRKTIVLADDDWHTGVIGIVASKMIDAFYRPTIMINTSNGLGQGSGRSIAGFNLHQGLAGLLGTFGQLRRPRNGGGAENPHRQNRRVCRGV